MAFDEEITPDISDNLSIRSTSTTKYHQERFEDFQKKVLKLFPVLFPPHDVVQVHRIRGGSWNRITGATLSNGARYIVRSPRYPDGAAMIPDQVAVLRFIHRHTTIPVPKTITFDIQTENPLQSAYTIQNWLDGRSLRTEMLETDVSDRMALARAVVDLMGKMYVTEPFPSPGVICAQDSSAETVVLSLPCPTGSPIIPSPPITDALTFLTSCYDLYSKEAEDRGDEGTPHYMKRLKAAAIALHAERPFSNRFCIMHPDFEPRNILVQKTADGEYEATAALDYDGAFVGPIEAIWSPPQWLWTWDLEDSGGDNEKRATLEPTLPETKAVKAYVEEELDRRFPGFMETWRAGFVARELVHFTIHDLDDDDRANRLLGLIPDSSSSNSSYEDGEATSEDVLLAVDPEGQAAFPDGDITL